MALSVYHWCIDDSVHAWEDLSHQIVDLYIPIKQHRVSIPNQPRWMTSYILQHIKIRDNQTTSQVSRKNNDPVFWKKYRATRNSMVNEIVTAKKSYFKSTIKPVFY